MTMKWSLGTYTGQFNRRHKAFGHLFSRRYKSLVVEGSGCGYLRTVCDYVHLNPIRAKLLSPEQALRKYRWTSWPEYLKSPESRWRWRRGCRRFSKRSQARGESACRKVLSLP